jgi:hypothetical protein
MDHHGSGMNVKSYDLCLVVDLDGVGQAGYGGLWWATGLFGGLSYHQLVGKEWNPLKQF